MVETVRISREAAISNGNLPRLWELLIDYAVQLYCAEERIQSNIKQEKKDRLKKHISDLQNIRLQSSAKILSELGTLLDSNDGARSAAIEGLKGVRQDLMSRLIAFRHRPGLHELCEQMLYVLQEHISLISGFDPRRWHDFTKQY